MNNFYNIRISVVSKTVKGQVFFRRLLKRQHSIISGFSLTRNCPRVL